MELAISAATGELVSRFVSFFANKYHSSRAYSEEKQLERLQLLLLRARTVVEEADGRYITNSGMLAQLDMLTEAMYRGYWALGAFRYRSLQETPMEEEQEDWAKFCSTLASMDSGSKVIITSWCKSSEKLGTVQPIFLNTLPYEEFSYLFKTLAFGSADPAQHPRLAQIADEMARELHSDWSLIAVNLRADVMRRNLNLHFWLCMLCRMRRFVERNFSMFGEHPQLLILRRHQIDVTDFLHSYSPLRILPSCTTGSSRTEITEERQLLPNVRLGDLVEDPGARPQGDFNVIS
ncbi:uncharacterized protein [Lolium perenne]|uniref:uncharacterized protein isoform X1 n=1 Tax=Lolium perenne TaxID=4522 RepID=UPI0021F5F8F5|nr:uncharacterized protein LOC127327278 isoform X1 [Lolium perenne]